MSDSPFATSRTTPRSRSLSRPAPPPVGVPGAGRLQNSWISRRVRAGERSVSRGHGAHGVRRLGVREQRSDLAVRPIASSHDQSLSRQIALALLGGTANATTERLLRALRAQAARLTAGWAASRAGVRDAPA
ncbi:hypothetical protein [Streptacidiphilus sp. MAP5-3]|uniref:hypothetical protein n=1 Tax=unclassified Streptacidiphilus TaxID=2643834 RepID=UPI0035164473